MRAILLIAICLIVSATWNAFAESDIVSLTALARKSIVYISYESTDDASGDISSNSATGFVVSSHGLIVTAAHVVKDWQKQNEVERKKHPIFGRLHSISDAGVVPLELVDEDDNADLAILKFRDGRDDYPVAALCFVEDLAGGTPVTAYGFPYEHEFTPFPATIANGDAPGDRWSANVDFVEGSSGGPVYNADGRVVGVVKGGYGSIAAIRYVTPVIKGREMLRKVSVGDICLDKPDPQITRHKDNSISTMQDAPCSTDTCSAMFTVAFSRDGRRLATGGRQGSIAIWSVPDGRPIQRLVGDAGVVNMVSYDGSQTGERVLSVGNDRVTLWDVRSGRPIFRLGGPRAKYDLASWSDDDRVLATSGFMAKLDIWNGITGQPIATSVGVGRVFALSPDGRFVAYPTEPGTIEREDLLSKEKKSFALDDEKPIELLRFDPSSRHILASFEPDVVVLVDATSGSIEAQMKVPGGSLKDAVFSPDGKIMALLALNGGVWLYSNHGERIGELKFKYRSDGASWAEQDGSPWSIAFSRAGDRVGAGSVNGEVVVWNVGDLSQTDYFEGHGTQQVMQVAFSPDGRYIASACFDGTVKLWELQDARRSSKQ